MALLRGRRRGTVLLLVLGALAMVLILTVVYAALGKGDRRMARTVERQQDTIEVISGIAGYIAAIVGQDTFDAVPDLTEESLVGAGVDARLHYRRENIDLPVTDFTFWSVPEDNRELFGAVGGQNSPGIELFKFNPTGGHKIGVAWPADLDPLYPRLDPRIANDPWLAATKPFDLGEGSKDFLSNGTYRNNPFYVRAIDWPQISNIAPDGRFVNLYYLRADAAGDAGSPTGIGVASIDMTRDPNTDEPRLTMFNEDGDLEIGDVELGFAGLLDNAGNPIPFTNETADWNRPAHWTMYQRAMYRSIAELNRLDSTNRVDEPTYWGYSYADADGDGMIDSRWVELVEAGGNGTETTLFPGDGRRYFVAARIIDLSSLVNVNTATDLIAPPTLQARLGEGPHEVSLFSLLSMSWHPQSMSLGTQSIDLAYGSGGANSIEGAFDFPADQGGADDYEIVGLTGDANANQGLLGIKGYKRAKQSIADWEPTPYELVPSRAEQDGVEDPNEDYRSDDMSLFTLALLPEERGGLYRSFGSTPMSVTAGGNGRVGPFGIDDQVELLTHWGANDPDVFTPLERAMVSEDRNETGLLSRSLLRSDRSLAAEVGDRTDLASGSTTGQPGFAERESNRYARSAVDVRSLLTTMSGSRPLRGGLVDSSGVTSLVRKYKLDALVLAPEIEYRFSTALGTGSDDAAAQQAGESLTQTLLSNTFLVYLDTLAPYLGEGDPWDTNLAAVDEADQRATLFYGHAGPELAVRLAAHMAVNFRDMADAPTIDANSNGFTDNSLLALADDLSSPANTVLFNRRADEPTRSLLWLTSDPARRTAAATASAAVDAFVNPMAGETPLVLDADDFSSDPATSPLLDSAPAGGGVAASQDALIIHGVEAQPFLSEVVFMNAFWDAPRGGDDEDPAGALGADNDPVSEYRVDRISGTAGNWNDAGMANIDWNPDGSFPGNPDFLFQMVAFQLFNPFDVPVRLDDMYIEFGDLFYRFEDILGPNELILAPRETVIAYATNPGLNYTGGAADLHTSVQARLDSAASTAGATVIDFETGFLDTNLISTNGAQPLRRIPLERYEMDAGAMTRLGRFAADADLLDGTLNGGNRQAFLANRVAMLWRDTGPNKADSAAGTLTWELADRRDDVMLDRLTDRPFSSGDLALDQRLFLDAEIIPEESENQAGTNVTIAQFTVENAINGYTQNVIVGEDPASSTANLNLNDYQSAAFLWGSFRRFDDPGLAVGATADLFTTDAGRSDAGYPQNAPPGAGGQPGNEVLLGSPVGALPANVLEVFEPLIGTGPFDVRASSLTESGLSAEDGLDATILFDASVPETSETLEDLYFRLVNDPAGGAGFRSRFETTSTGLLGFDRYRLGTTRQPIPTNALRTDVADDTTGVAYLGADVITFAGNGIEFRNPDTDPAAQYSQLRVGDMLLPMAVGPYRRPLAGGIAVTNDSTYPDDPNQRIQVYLAQWVTLGEILGVVAGYSERVSDATTTNQDAGSQFIDDPFNELRVIDVSASPAVETRRVLDRGRLRLDAFVPFFESDDGAATIGVYDPGFDRIRGHGVPLATTIFEIAQAGGELPSQAYGDIDRPMTGLVNVNTAPPSVLRTVPGLFPNTFIDSLPIGPGTPDASWFWDRRIETLATGATSLPHLNAFEPPSGIDVNEQLDIAASLLAYREPSTGHLLMTNAGNLAAGQPGPSPYDMAPVGLRADDPAMPTSFDASAGLGLARLNTGIGALRRSPGFGSLGELLAVRDVNAPDPQHGMDALARDGRTLGLSYLNDDVDPRIDRFAHLSPVNLPTAAGDLDPSSGVDPNGISTVIASLDPDLIGDPLLFASGADMQFELLGTDQVPDDYDEQLVQINMLLNSTSVSSDYYAAWFLVHGYDEDDTLGLGANDPLVPSFRGRYLVILDRSTVVEPGDQPTVVAFLPLPLEVPTEADPNAGL